MRPEKGSGKPHRKRASFSKATLRCPADTGLIPPRRPCRKKPPESGGFCYTDRASGAGPAGSQPFRATAVAVTIHHAAPEMAAPAFSMTPSVTRKHRQAPLLTIVQRLVERIGRIGDLLQGDRGHRHSLGAIAQACHRVGLLLVGLGIVGFARLGAIDSDLDQVTHRALNRRPEFF